MVMNGCVTKSKLFFPGHFPIKSIFLQMWISKAFYLLVGTSFYITSTIAALGGPSQASSSLDHEAAGAQQQEVIMVEVL